MNRSIAKSNSKGSSTSQMSSSSKKHSKPEGSSSFKRTTTEVGTAPDHVTCIGAIHDIKDWEKDTKFQSSTMLKWLPSQHVLSDEHFRALKLNSHVQNKLILNMDRKTEISYTIPNSVVVCGDASYSVSSFKIPDWNKAVIEIEWPLEPLNEPPMKKAKVENPEPESESDNEEEEERKSKTASQTKRELEKLTNHVNELTILLKKVMIDNEGFKKKEQEMEKTQEEMKKKCDEMQKEQEKMKKKEEELEEAQAEMIKKEEDMERVQEKMINEFKQMKNAQKELEEKSDAIHETQKGMSVKQTEFEDFKFLGKNCLHALSIDMDQMANKKQFPPAKRYTEQTRRFFNSLYRTPRYDDEDCVFLRPI